MHRSEATITITREGCIKEVPLKTWKSLIADLVLCGYAVHGDHTSLTFQLGGDDSITLPHKEK